MKSIWITSLAVLVLGLAGCTPPEAPPPDPPRDTPLPPPAPRPEARAEVSFDTAHDRRFGEFVAETAGGMITKVAVGIERKGSLRIQLSRTTDPEDTLPLIKSIMAGARKDFPGKAFTLSTYDPQGELIVKAYHDPDHGVRYEMANSSPGKAEPANGKVGQDGAASPSSAAEGTTERDRRFAQWAMKTGEKYLRYVQADLEKNGRIWFGVTRQVKPEDVTRLTKSLLEGAHTEFPRRSLSATVFDPEGERIGKATLDTNGSLRWDR